MSTSQECNALLLLANTAAGKLMQPDSERLQQEKTKHADNILLQQECEKHTAEIEKLQNTCAQLSIRVTQIEAELKAHKEREQLEKEQERCEVNAMVFMQQQANYKNTRAKAVGAFFNASRCIFCQNARMVGEFAGEEEGCSARQQHNSASHECGDRVLVEG
jgi:phage terminase large subunit-like protein